MRRISLLNCEESQHWSLTFNVLWLKFPSLLAAGGKVPRKPRSKGEMMTPTFQSC